MSSLSTTYSQPQQQRNIDKYREKAGQLFQKLQNLQESSEYNRSQKQKVILNEFNQTQKKVLQSSKIKEGWYGRIIEMVKAIETEIHDQKSEEEKCRRSIKTWVQSTEREINQNFQRLEKEKTKSEAALEKFVETKVQSFILKNKSAWNQGTLINQTPFLEEIDFLTQQHKKFLNEFQKQCEKLKKDTFASIKQATRLVEGEINNGEQNQVMAVMKAIHMDITSKLKSLRQQRERTEERVLSMLEKVVGSVCQHSSTD